MTRLVLILAAALTLALSLTPAFRHVATKTGFVDQPGGRKSHARPVPLLGGVGIYAAVVLAILFFGDAFFVRQTGGILIGGTMISFSGLWDDRRGLKPMMKVGIQLAAAMLVVATGIQIQLFESSTINVVLTLCWFVAVSNAFNLSDNMDGLSAGLGAIASFFFLILSAMNGQYLVGMLSAATMGACLGFLIYNVNPATIFMGDAGSLFIGFIIAATGVKLRFPDNTPDVTWMVPVLVLSVPLYDTLFVIASRIRHQQPILVGGRDHMSYVLLGRWDSPRRVVMVLYLMAVGSGLIGIAASLSSIRISIALFSVVFLWFGIGFPLLAHTGKDAINPSQDHSALPNQSENGADSTRAQ